MPMIAMAMHPVPISWEDTTACVSLDLPEMERIAQILTSVQRIDMNAMRTPHALMLTDLTRALVTQATREPVSIALTLMNARKSETTAT